MKASLTWKLAAFVVLQFATLPVGAGSETASLAEQLTAGSDFKDPLFYASAVMPSDAETRPLADLLSRVKLEDDPRAQAAFIEEYIGRYPDSTWTPSLRFHLGEYYRDRGRFTLALDHWERAWSAVNGLESAGGREVGDYVAVSLGRLLLRLGHHERLDGLLAQAAARKFGETRLQIAMDSLRENFGRTAGSPGQASLCGVTALAELAQIAAPGNDAMVASIKGIPGNAAGVSLLDLQRFGESAGLKVRAVRIVGSVPVPSAALAP